MRVKSGETFVVSGFDKSSDGEDREGRWSQEPFERHHHS